MDSGDASVPKRRTRQQFLKYCVELIEKRNRSSQNGNPTQSSTTRSVNIGEDVSCGTKRVKVEENTACGGGDKRKMGKWSEDGSMVRSLDKGKKKVDSVKRKFSPGTCDYITKRPFIEEISDSDDDDNDDSEEEESDPDVVIIAEGAADSIVNTGSGSGSWSNMGSVGLRSPMLNATDEVVSSTSSMCRTTGPSERRKSEEPMDLEKSEDFVDSFKSQQEFTDTIESSESKSEASSDDPEDKDYRVNESSTSSQSDNTKSVFDDDYDGRKESEVDDLTSPTENKNNEEGKGFDDFRNGSDEKTTKKEKRSQIRG